LGVVYCVEAHEWVDLNGLQIYRFVPEWGCLFLFFRSPAMRSTPYFHPSSVVHCRNMKRKPCGIPEVAPTCPAQLI
jgi:hypothetical protein